MGCESRIDRDRLDDRCTAQGMEADLRAVRFGFCEEVPDLRSRYRLVADSVRCRGEMPLCSCLRSRRFLCCRYCWSRIADRGVRASPRWDGVRSQASRVLADRDPRSSGLALPESLESDGAVYLRTEVGDHSDSRTRCTTRLRAGDLGSVRLARSRASSGALVRTHSRCANRLGYRG